MHVQSLKLLQPLGQGQMDVAQYSLHHLTIHLQSLEVLFPGLRRRCIYKQIHYLTIDLDLGVIVTQNVAQYFLHHVTHAPVKFEVAISKGLGGDAFTRNMTESHTHGWTKDRATLVQN